MSDTYNKLLGLVSPPPTEQPVKKEEPKQGGREKIEAMGYRVVPLFTRDELVGTEEIQIANYPKTPSLPPAA